MMSENSIFSRFSVVSEVSADDVFRYVLARDMQKEDQSVLVAQLQAPWRENRDVVEDLNEYFSSLQRVRAQGVMRVLTVTQNKEDGFGVVFKEPEGICLEEITDLDTSMQATEFVDNLCEAIHKANVKGVFHCHLGRQDIWVSGNTVGITGFGYSVVAKHGWKGDSVDMPPELVSGREIDSRSDVYSIGLLLAEQYPNHKGDLLRALKADPEQRYRKAREFHGEISEQCKSWKCGMNGVKPKQKTGLNPKSQDSALDSSTTSARTQTQTPKDTNMAAQGEERLRELVRNMVFDNYCDQKTERDLRREAINNLGMDQADAIQIIALELETMGAANERRLLEELEANLQQKANSRGKKLQSKEKQDVLDIVCRPRRGYIKGLDRQTAEQRFVEYCRAHGVKLKSGLIGWKVP